MPEGTPPQAQDSAPTKGDDDQSFWMLWCSMMKPTMDRLNAEMGNSPAPTISRQQSYSFNDSEIKGMASAIEYSAHCPYRLDPQLLNFALQIFKYHTADVQAKIEEIEKLKADMSKPANRQ
jgi:hypothetical protein